MSRAPWTLSAASFDGLLTLFDADRDRAAVEYEHVRARLVKLFEWRGCTRPDEYADRTLDRVARRIAEGAEITTRDPYAFVHGVALNLLQEYWREPAARWTSLDDVPEAAAAHPPEPDGEADLACLDECLASLKPDARRMLARYHTPGGGHIQARRTLATELGIPMNALRIRVFRLRVALEACVSGCIERKTS
jgi:DNA-directed RNA polymerase specialized sigma24 family protein